MLGYLHSLHSSHGPLASMSLPYLSLLPQPFINHGHDTKLPRFASDFSSHISEFSFH